MAQNYRDPFSYLNEAVTKRGKSGPDGVYLHNVTVVAESTSDYNYKVSYGEIVTPFSPPVGVEWEDWATLLITIRSNTRALSHEIPIFTNSSLWQFLPEGNSLSLNVFAPRVDVCKFPYDLKLAQDSLLCVSDFCSKVPGTIRFNIGLSTKSWEDMAEQGEVEERDLNY